jgi:hypothetical protein
VVVDPAGAALRVPDGYAGPGGADATVPDGYGTGGADATVPDGYGTARGRRNSPAWLWNREGQTGRARLAMEPRGADATVPPALNRKATAQLK